MGKSNIRRRLFVGLLMLPLAISTMAQTRVDLSRQATGTEFLQPPFSAPIRSGTQLPASCAVGELFFLATAPAGANIHVCHATDEWAVQGSGGQGALEIQNNGVSVGVRSVLNFVPGNGVSQATADLGSRIDVQSSIDTATMQSKRLTQSGEVLNCTSSGGSGTSYTCAMLPTLSVLTPGMVVFWRPDISNDHRDITLSIDAFDPMPIRLADGVSQARVGDFSAGRNYPLWFDGSSFRVMQPPILEDYQTRSGAQSGQELFCLSTGGSSIAYSCALNPQLQSYSAGLVVRWRPDVDPAGGSITLNIDGLGDRAIRRSDGVSDPVSGEIRTGELYLLWFNGVEFRIIQSLPLGLARDVSVQNGNLLLCQSAGGNGASYACPMTPPLSSLHTGMVLHWIPDVDAVPGLIQLTVNNLSPVPITLADGASQPQLSDIRAAQLYQLWYDGSTFRLLSIRQSPPVDASIPACTSSYRGRLWLIPGEAGVKDELRVCTKDETDQYEWKMIL